MRHGAAILDRLMDFGPGPPGLPHHEGDPPLSEHPKSLPSLVVTDLLDEDANLHRTEALVIGWPALRLALTTEFCELPYINFVEHFCHIIYIYNMNINEYHPLLNKFMYTPWIPNDVPSKLLPPHLALIFDPTLICKSSITRLIWDRLTLDTN